METAGTAKWPDETNGSSKIIVTSNFDVITTEDGMARKKKGGGGAGKLQSAISKGLTKHDALNEIEGAGSAKKKGVKKSAKKMKMM